MGNLWRGASDWADLQLRSVCLAADNSGRNPVGQLDFYCQKKGRHCLYSSSPFAVETKEIQPWIHLKFLQLQVAAKALSPPPPVSRATHRGRHAWHARGQVGNLLPQLRLGPTSWFLHVLPKKGRPSPSSRCPFRTRPQTPNQHGRPNGMNAVPLARCI